MSAPHKHAPTLAYLRNHRTAILALAAQYGASNIRVFGSVARGESREDSDVDLLVSYQDGTSLLDVVALWQDLEALLAFRVDVVDDRAIKPRYRAHIFSEAVEL